MPRTPHVFRADWPAYYTARSNAPPRQTLLHALGRFDREPPSGNHRRAVDLGCGVGNDTLELLKRGWQVHALDSNPAALRGLLSHPELPHKPRLVALLSSIQDSRWPKVDLVNASYALPFCPPESFADVWNRIVASLRPGGRFAGQLFGDADDWAVVATHTHHTRSTVEELLRAFEVELFREVQYDGVTAAGASKHWHVFDIVARLG